MNKSRVLGALCALFAFTSLPTFASPWGTEYFVLLDGVVDPSIVPPDPENGNVEGHLGPVFFDGISDYVPNDLIPNTPALPGNGLLVTEDAITNPDGSETISIWIDSAGENCPELFCNALDPFSSVLFNIEQLYWVEGPAAVVSDIEVIVTFFPGDPGTLITPLFTDIFGLGSFEDPLFLTFELNPSDLDGATDLHLEFTVGHAVPIPAAIWLFSSGLLGLIGISRRSSRAA